MTTESTTGYTAKASVHVAEPPDRVWAELMHPGARWMLGANISTDFRPGSPITFEGHWRHALATLAHRDGDGAAPARR